jgi:hypothetical protein
MLLDPEIAVLLHVERMERAHLDVLVLLHHASRDLQTPSVRRARTTTPNLRLVMMMPSSSLLEWPAG